MPHHLENLQTLLAQGQPFVSVTLVDVIASAPQNIGAKILVTPQGLHAGTIGGGKVEAAAIRTAQQLLSEKAANKFVEWNLQRDLAMTCGGVVKLFFETYHAATWNITLFGAGHCAQALTTLLLTLQCQLTVLDSRPDWLEKLPTHSRLHTILADQPLPTYVPAIPDNASVILMTMGHATDLPILLQILRTRSFPYLGVIGSDAKANNLRKAVRDAHLPDNNFTCPIGLPLGNNDPAEIAISITAQLLQSRDNTTPKTS